MWFSGKVNFIEIKKPKRNKDCVSAMATFVFYCWMNQGIWRNQLNGRFNDSYKCINDWVIVITWFFLKYSCFKCSVTARVYYWVIGWLRFELLHKPQKTLIRMNPGRCHWLSKPAWRLWSSTINKHPCVSYSYESMIQVGYHELLLKVIWI